MDRQMIRQLQEKIVRVRRGRTYLQVLAYVVVLPRR